MPLPRWCGAIALRTEISRLYSGRRIASPRLAAARRACLRNRPGPGPAHLQLALPAGQHLPRTIAHDVADPEPGIQDVLLQQLGHLRPQLHISSGNHNAPPLKSTPHRDMTCNAVSLGGARRGAVPILHNTAPAPDITPR